MTEMSYNEKYSIRTKQFAVQAVLFYTQYCKRTEELRVIGKQFLRSATSVAANFRAFVRGRSEAEKYSKLCIVLEEIDETVFWLEIIEETKLIETDKFQQLKTEANELLKIMAVTRKNMKNKQ